MTREQCKVKADELYPERDKSLDFMPYDTHYGGKRTKLYLYAADETEEDGKRHLATIE